MIKCKKPVLYVKKYKKKKWNYAIETYFSIGYNKAYKF